MKDRNSPLSFQSSAAAKVGGIILLAALLVSLASLLGTPQDPFAMNSEAQFEKPTLRHLFGTDNFGRDILSRTMVGLRYSLFFALAAVAASSCAGTALGIALAFAPRWLSESVMRVVDAVSAIPLVLLALVLLQALRAAETATNGGSLIAAMTFVFTPAFVRITRNETRAVKKLGYIDHAKVLGAGDFRIMYAHILPVLLPSILSTAVIAFANSILIESVLSYLGFGIQPPLPSLGRMLFESQGFLFNAPWGALFPGIVAAVLLAGVNYAGEALKAPKSPGNRRETWGEIPSRENGRKTTQDASSPLFEAFGVSARGVVRDVALRIEKGECVGIAGESGTGKTTLILALFRFIPSGGRVFFRGKEITNLNEEDMAVFLAKETGFVFQDPQATLNPLMTIAEQILERMKLQPGATKSSHREDSASRLCLQKVLADVGLPRDDAFLKRYPHELSGGQQQRVVIAQAIIHKPPLIIADEPTASLDPEVRDEIAGLLERLARENGAALMLVTHDWPLLLRMGSRVYVMHKGAFVEEGSPSSILGRPSHAYTKAVARALEIQRAFKNR